MRFDGLDMWSYRGQLRRPIYTTIGQLYVWAQSITNATQEGEPYHDSLSLWQSMIQELTTLFNGSMDYTNPLTGQTIKLLKVVDSADDMQEAIFIDYNIRQVWWPVFDRSTPFTTDAAIQNRQMYATLKHFCNKVHRYFTSHQWSIYKTLGILAVEYNPIADYWRRGVELGASAPYITLTNPGEGEEEPTITDWNKDQVDDNTRGYHSHSSADGGKNMPTVKTYTTTDDDASTGRLANYQTTEGGTFNDTEMPNSGAIKKYKEEGNKGTFSPQEMIEKELELNSKVGDVLRNFLNGLMNETCLNVIYED